MTGRGGGLFLQEDGGQRCLGGVGWQLLGPWGQQAPAPGVRR